MASRNGKEMKICPDCRTQYTDDSLRFCLQDGSTLVDAQSMYPSVSEPDEAETIVSNRQETENFGSPSSQKRALEFERAAEQRPKSNTSRVVLGTALVTLLFLGTVAAIWLYVNRGEEATVQNTDISSANRNDERSIDSNSGIQPSVTATPKQQSSNADLSLPAGAGDREAKRPPPIDRGRERAELVQRIEDWKSDSESLSLNAVMSNYADSVDYYRQRGASAEFVRNDKQRAFSAYDSINFEISNVDISVDDSGEGAAVTFDKAWLFEGESRSAGKVRQQLKLKKIDGQWRITGEKDLKLYFKE